MVQCVGYKLFDFFAHPELIKAGKVRRKTELQRSIFIMPFAKGILKLYPRTYGGNKFGGKNGVGDGSIE